MILQTVALLIDDARVIIYNCNMFIIQATGAYKSKVRKENWPDIILSIVYMCDVIGNFYLARFKVIAW